MASRASVYSPGIRRLDNIQHFVLIPYSPCGLRTYRLRRISYTPTADFIHAYGGFHTRLRRDWDAKGERHGKKSFT